MEGQRDRDRGTEVSGTSQAACCSARPVLFSIYCGLRRKEHRGPTDVHKLLNQLHILL